MYMLYIGNRDMVHCFHLHRLYVFLQSFFYMNTSIHTSKKTYKILINSNRDTQNVIKLSQNNKTQENLQLAYKISKLILWIQQIFRTCSGYAQG